MLSLKTKELSSARDVIRSVCREIRLSFSKTWLIHTKRFSLISPRDMEVVVSRMQPSVGPKASPETLPELATYLEPFAPLLRRSTSRASLERYLTGLLTDLPRKNCDTIAVAVAETSTERLHHLLTEATWKPQALDQQRVTA